MTEVDAGNLNRGGAQAGEAIVGPTDGRTDLDSKLGAVERKPQSLQG